MSSELEIILQKLTEVEGSTKKTLEEFEKRINTKLENIENRLSNVESKVGVTFEVSARSEIRLRYGNKCASPFMVKDLYGLTRIPFPKEEQIFEHSKEGISKYLE